MSSSLKERFIMTLLGGIIGFVTSYIMIKLTNYSEDWLYFSTISGVSLSLGYLVSTYSKLPLINEGIVPIFSCLTTILLSFLIIVTLTGILINLPTLEDTINIMSVTFTTSFTSQYCLKLLTQKEPS